MPLPLFLVIGAAVAGAAGVGGATAGGVKMKKAKDTMKSADSRHQKNISRLKSTSSNTTAEMDKLGKLELEILKSFDEFSELFEKIKNKPEFEQYSTESVNIPQYNGEELKKASVGAGILLGGIGGVAAGALGGFAASGATTAAVMALGTASTGTAISSLSGAAAANATLAALGGGAISAGGGGMALGSAVLGGATLGAALLVGGIIFSITGYSLSKKADEAWNQMKQAENEINGICGYLGELKIYASKYRNSLTSVNEIYKKHLYDLHKIIIYNLKTDWTDFTNEEKLITENTVLLVSLLFNMCKVKFVLESKNKNGQNQINKVAINESVNKATEFMNVKGFNLV